ncbi:MAG: helix-turn-helix domain-containing protein [Promethearchaeota archaeon]
MGNMKLTDIQLQETVAAYTKANGNITHAAKLIGRSRKTFRYRLQIARERGMVVGDTPSCADTCNEVTILRKKVRDLTLQSSYLKKEKITNTEIREFLFGLKKINPHSPDWLLKPMNELSFAKGNVPCLLLSDFHWGETIFSDQVFGVNEYNLEIAHERVKRLISNTVEVLKRHMVKDLNFPGLVIALNGDFFSGDIHEELSKSNEVSIMPAFIDLFDVMIWALEVLSEEFSKLMVFGTAGGNHARLTKKSPYKDAAYTNFDWLLYCMLERHFKNNKNIQFHISSGVDVQFNIYNHKFRQTHGDQFRGGTGFVGPFAPITRGEIKKRSAAATYDMSYDTLLIGHYHTYMPMNRVIANGSLVGFSEFSLGNNFPYEDPVQALFIVNAKRGITFNIPVFCEDKKDEDDIKLNREWVSWETE